MGRHDRGDDRQVRRRSATARESRSVSTPHCAHRTSAAHETSFATQLAYPDDFVVAGTASCRECHADDCIAWDKSPHAQAWQTLADTGAEVDSYCQQCHTTNYGIPGGFVSAQRSPDRLAVGCECLPRRVQSHVRNPEVHTVFYRRARDQCLRCHDQENSPQFDYDKYWQEIVHGEQDDAS